MTDWVTWTDNTLFRAGPTPNPARHYNGRFVHRYWCGWLKGECNCAADRYLEPAHADR
jgi:hypothetical protein